MNATWWITKILYNLAEVVPWLIGLVGGVALVSFSPLGRALLRHLRERRRDTALTESVLTELTTLRESLAEVVERLDATEHRLARDAASLRRPESSGTHPPELRDPDRIPTPS